MPELRGFVKDNVMDILYYSSAVNSQVRWQAESKALEIGRAAAASTIATPASASTHRCSDGPKPCDCLHTGTPRADGLIFPLFL